MKLEPLTFDGIVYTPAQIMSLRQPLGEIRDCLIAQGHLPHAMAMTHIYVLLKHLAENTKEP